MDYDKSIVHPCKKMTFHNILLMKEKKLKFSCSFVHLTTEKIVYDIVLYFIICLGCRYLQYMNHHASFLKKSPVYSCITLFNSLQVHIRNLQSKSLFKKSLLRYLTTHCFYCANEHLAKGYPTEIITRAYTI